MCGVQLLMRPLLILRPEPGNGESCARAQSMGLTAVCCPLFEIEPLLFPMPNIAGYDGVLLTSANAVRSMGKKLVDFEALPLLCVGERTAQAVRELGIEPHQTGSADVQQLFSGVQQRRLLHLGGEDVTPVASSKHKIDHVAIYKNRAVAPPSDFAQYLTDRPIALLHSVRAAHRFADLVPEQRNAIMIAAISAKVATASGTGWEMVEFAANPRDDDLMNLAMSMATSR